MIKQLNLIDDADPVYVCPCCGYEDDPDVFGKYCPSCGVDLDEEEKEINEMLAALKLQPEEEKES